MFDRIYNQTHPRHQTVSVNEHRAPTDESIRIYKEMEEKAERSIIARGHLKNNVMDGEWVVREDHLTGEATAIFRFLLNGKEHRVDVAVMRRDFQIDPQRAARALCDAVQRKLAEIVTYKLFETCTDSIPTLPRHR